MQGKAKDIFGGVHYPNLPTNRRRSRLICRQMGLSLSFVSKLNIGRFCTPAPPIATPLHGNPIMQPMYQERCGSNNRARQI